MLPLGALHRSVHHKSHPTPGPSHGHCRVTTKLIYEAITFLVLPLAIAWLGTTAARSSPPVTQLTWQWWRATSSLMTCGPSASLMGNRKKTIFWWSCLRKLRKNLTRILSQNYIDFAITTYGKDFTGANGVVLGPWINNWMENGIQGPDGNSLICAWHHNSR